MHMAFQSLIGFKINWNQIIINYLVDFIFKFQSLIGFKINWNEKFPESAHIAGWFQSLIGFKINWNGERKSI